MVKGNMCENCGDECHIPDDKTGLIHRHGKYACYQKVDGKIRRMETVAE